MGIEPIDGHQHTAWICMGPERNAAAGKIGAFWVGGENLACLEGP